jgi:uncharacterized protein YndB with AHSA1/START domain
MPAANSASTTTFSTPSDREVAITRVVEAPRRLVFDAWTKPEHLPHWMLGPSGWTMPICEIDLRPGGAYRFVWRRTDGTEMQIHGIYKEIAPPERLVFTESWGAQWPDTINTLMLTEQGNKVTMTLTVLYPSKEARETALQTGMKDGVVVSYDRLAEYLGRIG